MQYYKHTCGERIANRNDIREVTPATVCVRNTDSNKTNR